MGGEKKIIFLIEDDEILVKMYRLKLEKEGFRVEVANDGQMALLRLKEKSFKPDLILLDIIMPKMDGYNFLKKAREENLLPLEVPVFVLTNIVVNNKEKKKGNDLGVIDFWVKSQYSPSEIIKKIKEFLNKKE